MKCCFCENEVGEYGNSAWPLNEEERCCDACNLRYVISARLAIISCDKEELPSGDIKLTNITWGAEYNF